MRADERAPVADERHSGYPSGANRSPRPSGARGWPLPLLRRLRNWFLFGAIVVFLILFAGLIHDFGQSDVNVGWFTSRPIIPAVLLGIGYLLMLGYRFGSRGEEEEEEGG
ncbi:MAG: hypothetical protein ACRDI2_02460 [Chloroflexota bacterium]